MLQVVPPPDVGGGIAAFQLCAGARSLRYVSREDRACSFRISWCCRCVAELHVDGIGGCWNARAIAEFLDGREFSGSSKFGRCGFSWRGGFAHSDDFILRRGVPAERLAGEGTGGTHQAIWLLSGRRDTASEAVTPRKFGMLEWARSKALQMQTDNNWRQWGLAFHNFHDTYGAFPPGGTMTHDGELLHGWAMFVGPFHSFTAPDLDFRREWRVPPNDRIYKCQGPEFLNPSQPGAVFDDEGFGLCHWAGNVHVLPVRTVQIDAATGSEGPGGNAAQLGGQTGGVSLAQITDGTSSTILLGTVGQHFKPWGHPANVRDPALGINRSPDGFGGPPGWNGAMFLMCDGSVKFLRDDTDLSIMKAHATPAGGEPNPDDSALQHP